MCCTFSGSTPSLVPVPYMSHNRWWGATPSLDPYFFCTFWGSTPSQAPVPYMSYVRWWNVSSISGSISSSVYPNIICSLHIPYICIFQGDFWYPWMTIWSLLFNVDLETFSKMKLICVHTHYYWSIPFSPVKSIFYNFFTCMPHICSWSTSYTSLQVQPSKDFSTIWVTKWSKFFGFSTPSPDPSLDPYLCSILLSVHSISSSSLIYVLP